MEMNNRNNCGAMLRRACAVLATLIASFVFAADPAQKAAGDATAMAPAGGGEKTGGQGDATYLIGPEDVLEISVWKEDSLKKETLVRPDGGISFPLAGEIHAAGKTAPQIKAEIAARIEKFIPDPVVSVAVLRVANNKVYVIGKVNKPGEFTLGRYVDVMQALGMAGGLTAYAAANRIKILRKENGKDVAIPFAYSKIERGESLEQNILLRGGDTVVVP
jgi:polysaccharide export outer membrane protein